MAHPPVHLAYFEVAPEQVDAQGGLTRHVSELLPVAETTSEASFQASHALADLGLLLARSLPTLGAARLCARLDWTLPDEHGLCLPQLRAVLPDGRAVRRAYPQSALRGGEVLGRLSATEPALARRRLFFVAGPSPEASLPAASAAAFTLDDGEDAGMLPLWTESFQVLEAGPDPTGLPTLGEGCPEDIPAACPEALLRALVREVADADGDFAERAWWLLGRVVRCGPLGDLLVLCEEALPVPDVSAGPTWLTIPESAKTGLTRALAERNAGRPPLDRTRLVGWVHTHDGEAIARATSSPAGEAPDARDIPGAGEAIVPFDARFFSALDVALHRKDFGPAAVALVVDAGAARTRPEDLGGCIAVFGTLSGVVQRRALTLLPPTQE
ncbi:MAG: hypothetical protein ABIO70_15630 [Pseudomonadota bacterium]